jgi:hypothetical protein
MTTGAFFVADDNIAQPTSSRMFAHRPHQQIVIDAVDESLDIQIQNPCVTPAPLVRHSNGFRADLPGRYPEESRSNFGSTRGLRNRLTTICAMRSATVGGLADSLRAGAPSRLGAQSGPAHAGLDCDRRYGVNGSAGG